MRALLARLRPRPLLALSLLLAVSLLWALGVGQTPASVSPPHTPHSASATMAQPLAQRPPVAAQGLAATSSRPPQTVPTPQTAPSSTAVSPVADRLLGPLNSTHPLGSRAHAQIQPEAAAAAVAVASQAPARAAARASRHDTEQELERLAARQLIDPAQLAAYQATLREARASQLPAVRRLLALSDRLARSQQLSRRHRLVMETLAVNLTQPAAAAGARQEFGAGPVVYQSVAGWGWQAHPLANWGKIAGLSRLKSRSARSQLQSRVDAMLDLAVQDPATGSSANEYLFEWMGKPGPWISAMPLATSLRPLAVVYARSQDERYAQALRGRLAMLDTPASQGGVKLERGEGRSHLLLYGNQPDLLVGNGFLQTLIGLHEYLDTAGAQAPAREQAQRLLGEARAEAEAILLDYDTGSWSYYALGPRRAYSNLHYHRFFGELLQKACGYFQTEPYCGMKQRFAVYPTLTPRLGRVSVKPMSGARLKVRVWSASHGSGKLSLWKAGAARPLRIQSVGVARGMNEWWIARPKPGRWRVKAESTSMDGQSSGQAEQTLRLEAARKR